eukprot:SAG31_NODE_17514_length_668_cov_0.637961_1_plen_198_part_00
MKFDDYETHQPRAGRGGCDSDSGMRKFVAYRTRQRVADMGLGFAAAVAVMVVVPSLFGYNGGTGAAPSLQHEAKDGEVRTMVSVEIPLQNTTVEVQIPTKAKQKVRSVASEVQTEAKPQIEEAVWNQYLAMNAQSRREAAEWNPPAPAGKDSSSRIRPPSAWSNLTDLIVVAGHAVYTGANFETADGDTQDKWTLLT